jgi:hypothetical protein
VDGEHIVVHEPTDVMLVRVADQLSEIQRAPGVLRGQGGFARAEVLRGVRSGVGDLQRVRRGTSVAAVNPLAQPPDADRTRPTLEYYRRRDVIDILVPIV